MKRRRPSAAEKRKQQGLCSGCGQTNDRPGRYECSACAKDRQPAARARYQARLSAGLCGGCGARPARAGKTTCDTCLVRNVGATGRMRARARGAAPGTSSGADPPGAGGGRDHAEQLAGGGLVEAARPQPVGAWGDE